MSLPPKKDTLFCLLLYACQQWRARFHRKHWQLNVGKSQWSDRKIYYLPVEWKIRKTATCNKQEFTFPLETSTTSNEKTTSGQPSPPKIKARWQTICQTAALSTHRSSQQSSQFPLCEFTWAQTLKALRNKSMSVRYTCLSIKKIHDNKIPNLKERTVRERERTLLEDWSTVLWAACPPPRPQAGL